MLLYFDSENIELDKTHNINFDYNEMEIQNRYKDNEFIEGNWNIDFEIDGKKLAKEMKVIELNKEVEFEYKNNLLKVKLEELRVTPMSIRLHYTYDLGLFEKATNESEHLDFKFYDENNKEINTVSQGGGGNEQGEMEMSTMWMIDREVSKIKVVPMIKKYSFFGIDKKFEESAIEIDIK